MSSRLYVGNLPPDVRSSDLEDIFYKYGKIQSIDIKADPGRRGPPFAFVEYDDSRDAEDAVKSRDGYNFDGYTVRVEFSRGGVRGGGRGGFGSSSFGGPPSGRGGGGGSGGGASRRTDYRVNISGLPTTGSWQDIKDHMRVAGDVCYADVYRDGTGVCEFVRYEDMKYAIKKLDDSKFRSHEGESSYIRVREEGGRSNSRSRSRSPRRSRSRSRS